MLGFPAGKGIPADFHPQAGEQGEEAYGAKPAVGLCQQHNDDQVANVGPLPDDFGNGEDVDQGLEPVVGNPQQGFRVEAVPS